MITLTREEAQQVLDALEKPKSHQTIWLIKQLRARLSAPEPEQLTLHKLARRCLWIAYVWNDHNFDAAHKHALQTAEKCGIHSFDDANDWLMALPKQRQWKGLTDEEAEQIVDAHWNDPSMFIEAIETKLKEKNS